MFDARLDSSNYDDKVGSHEEFSLGLNIDVHKPTRQCDELENLVWVLEFVGQKWLSTQKELWSRSKIDQLNLLYLPFIQDIHIDKIRSN